MFSGDDAPLWLKTIALVTVATNLSGWAFIEVSRAFRDRAMDMVSASIIMTGIPVWLYIVTLVFETYTAYDGTGWWYSMLMIWMTASAIGTPVIHRAVIDEIRAVLRVYRQEPEHVRTPNDHTPTSL